MIGFKSVEKTGFFKSILERFMPGPLKPKVFCSECKHYAKNIVTTEFPRWPCGLPGQYKHHYGDDNPIDRGYTRRDEVQYTDAWKKNKNNHCKDYSPKENIWKYQSVMFSDMDLYGM